MTKFCNLSETFLAFGEGSHCNYLSMLWLKYVSGREFLPRIYSGKPYHISIHDNTEIFWPRFFWSKCSMDRWTLTNSIPSLLLWLNDDTLLFVHFWSWAPGGNWSWALQWRHNEWDGVSNHRRFDCLLLNSLFRCRSKKTSKRHWPLWGKFTCDPWIPRTKGQ